MDKLKQKELISASSRGDKSAYAELIRSYYEPVFGQCLSMLGNQHDAEDITQDVLLKGYMRIGQLRNPDMFSYWLHTIARNHCNTFLSGKKQTAEFVEELSESQEPDYNDDHEHLQWAIEKLPAELRTPLVLYYFHGKTLRAVAEQLGASLTDVHRKVRCALAQLYQLMREQGDKV